MKRPPKPMRMRTPAYPDYFPVDGFERVADLDRGPLAHPAGEEDRDLDLEHADIGPLPFDRPVLGRPVAFFRVFRETGIAVDVLFFLYLGVGGQGLAGPVVENDVGQFRVHPTVYIELDGPLVIAHEGLEVDISHVPGQEQGLAARPIEQDADLPLFDHHQYPEEDDAQDKGEPQHQAGRDGIPEFQHPWFTS